MTQQPPTVNPWSDDDNSVFLRLRMKTFWNGDYFERIILPLLDLPHSGRVLDVGCGNGGISLLLSDLRPDLQILGMDFEPKPLEDARAYASRNGLANLTFEQGDAHNLKYDDATFDGVLCQTVLTHVRDAQLVVKEMTRVLKSGGVFFAAVRWTGKKRGKCLPGNKPSNLLGIAQKSRRFAQAAVPGGDLRREPCAGDGAGSSYR